MLSDVEHDIDVGSRSSCRSMTRDAVSRVVPSALGSRAYVVAGAFGRVAVAGTGVAGDGVGDDDDEDDEGVAQGGSSWARVALGDFPNHRLKARENELASE